MASFDGVSEDVQVGLLFEGLKTRLERREYMYVGSDVKESFLSIGNKAFREPFLDKVFNKLMLWLTSLAVEDAGAHMYHLDQELDTTLKDGRFLPKNSERWKLFKQYVMWFLYFHDKTKAYASSHALQVYEKDEMLRLPEICYIAGEAFLSDQKLEEAVKAFEEGLRIVDPIEKPKVHSMLDKELSSFKPFISQPEPSKKKKKKKKKKTNSRSNQHVVGDESGEIVSNQPCQNVVETVQSSEQDELVGEGHPNQPAQHVNVGVETVKTVQFSEQDELVGEEGHPNRPAQHLNVGVETVKVTPYVPFTTVPFTAAD